MQNIEFDKNDYILFAISDKCIDKYPMGNNSIKDDIIKSKITNFESYMKIKKRYTNIYMKTTAFVNRHWVNTLISRHPEICKHNLGEDDLVELYYNALGIVSDQNGGN